MLNVKFSCEIKKKKRIFLENQNSLLMIISTHGSVWVCFIACRTGLAQKEEFEELIDRNSASLGA